MIAYPAQNNSLIFSGINIIYSKLMDMLYLSRFLPLFC